ncbi:MAG: hypothetical protein GX864_04410 [Mollicutes bacterium]|jgi:hypothetical protein|nr:hypothetical protein [Mollicutes bacterium]
MKKTDVMFIWLFLTALLLTMTTYAWFSTNIIFEIESFDIQVVSRGGIEISTDGVNWKGVLGMLDFFDADQTYPTNLNQITTSVKPVSTDGSVEDGLLKLYYGDVDIKEQGNQYLYAVRSKEEKYDTINNPGHFVTFDIFLKSYYNRKINIDPISGVKYIEGTTSGIENAFRLGFLHQGTLSEETNLRQIQNLKDASKTYIWEPNSDAHMPSAVEHAQNIYNINTQEIGAQRITYHGISTEIPKTANVKVNEANSNHHPEYFKLVNPDITTTKHNTTPQYLFDIVPGITKIRVYIWIEGQDIDCEDGSTNGKLEINIQLFAE